MVNAKSKMILLAIIGMAAVGLFMKTLITAGGNDKQDQETVGKLDEKLISPPLPSAIIENSDTGTKKNNKAGDGERKKTIVDELKFELTKDSVVTEAEADEAGFLLDIVIGRKELKRGELQVVGDQIFDTLDTDGDDLLSSDEFGRVPQLIRQYELMQPPGTDIYLPGDIFALENLKLQRNDIVSIIDRVFPFADGNRNDSLDNAGEIRSFARNLFSESIDLVEFYEYSKLIESEMADLTTEENQD